MLKLVDHIFKEYCAFKPLSCDLCDFESKVSTIIIALTKNIFIECKYSFDGCYQVRLYYDNHLPYNIKTTYGINMFVNNEENCAYPDDFDEYLSHNIKEIDNAYAMCCKIDEKSRKLADIVLPADDDIDCECDSCDSECADDYYDYDKYSKLLCHFDDVVDDDKNINAILTHISLVLSLVITQA